MARKQKELMTKGNVRFSYVSLESIMRGRHFNLGFKDRKAGLPWRDLPHPGDQTDYERGRHFAAIYDGPVKNGKKLCAAAKARCEFAFISGELL